MTERRRRQRGPEDGPADPAVLRQYAVKMLARRDHGRAELRVKMARKFGDSDGLDAALDWCQEHDFLNDRRFAGFFVRSRIERGQGPLRIRSELQQRGLPEALIKEALDQAECDWFALARETHARRFRQPPADRKEKARQLRFLQSRGFDAEQSFNALDLAGEEDLD